MRRVRLPVSVALALALVGVPLTGQAQSGRVPRIGWLVYGGMFSETSRGVEADLLRGLRDLGYVDGRTVAIAYRHAEGRPERLPALATELVRLNVDLLVGMGGDVALPLKNATSSIPIVVATSTDPVRSQLAASLARPGGNLTGVTFLFDELAGKRVELLRELMPGAARLGVLWDPTHRDNDFPEMQGAARRLGLQLQSLEVRRPDDVDGALRAASQERVDALIVVPSRLTALLARRITEVAAAQRIPVISGWREFAEAGALLTYGPNRVESARRMASYVDRVLKGARPADLPIEQPTQFELVVKPEDREGARPHDPGVGAAARRRHHPVTAGRYGMRRIQRMLGALLVVVGLAGVAGAQPARDVLVVGMEAEPPGLDPGQALGLHTLRVTHQIFETLVTTPDDSTDIVPGLAESWSVSPDGLDWTFKLRKGVKFHDGTPLDAAAVKFTFDRVIDPAHPHAKSGKWSFVVGYLSSVKSVEVVDPATVRLHLKYPNGALLANLAIPNCAIVSPTAFARAPADFSFQPVGSGRYRFESWERGTRLVLRRNEDYAGVKGKPRTLVYRGIPEANARVTELLTGGVDLILPIPPDFVTRLESTPQVTVHKKTGLTIWYVGMNVEKKPFTDKRVRQALNYAVNKEAIVRDILKGTGIPATGPLLPGTWAHEPNVRKYPYDPAMAKRLLAEAGYPNGFEVEFWVPESGSGMQAPVEMSTVIQANLAAVGVKASLKTMEWGSYLGKLRSDAPPMFALSWFLKSEDPDLSLHPTLFSKSAPLPNRANYANPEVDELLIQARQAADRAKRAELYRRVQRIVVEDAPWIFVDHEIQVVATRAGLKGFKLHPSGFDLRVEHVE